VSRRGLARLAGLALAITFASIAMSTEALSIPALVDRLTALTPADTGRASLIDERRLVCDALDENEPPMSRLCTGALVVDTGAGVVTAKLLVAFEHGRPAHVIVKLPAVKTTAPRDELARRFGTPCETSERPKFDEDGENIGRSVYEGWVRARHDDDDGEPRVVVAIRDPDGVQGIGVVFDVPDEDVAELERKCGR